MLNFVKKLIIIFNLLLLNSCLISEALTMPKSWGWGFKARPYMARGLPDGDDDYSLGFRDGCKSLLGVVAQGLLRNTKPQYDGWKLTSNSLYAAGFYDGEEHCAYIYDWEIV